MPITKNPGRQDILVAMVDINFADVASGVDAAAVELPGGAIVVGGDVTVITPFNSASSDVLDVGDAGSQNRLLNDANIHAAGRAALVPTGYVMPQIGNLTVRWVGVGAVPTAGKVRLTVHYVVEKRAHSAQG
jgi:hypothetical protein